ncbi:MAG: response regulator [Synechococcales cyanobacterium M58_A2018_015]|nr:response regulator [Synechococcales cyanobacterium M58_A2018_015]
MVRNGGVATSIDKTLVNVLLIEDNLAEARFLQEILKHTGPHRFQFSHVQRLTDALQQLANQTFDVLLLDLSLPDSQGLASLEVLIRHAPSLPIVVLTNTNDDELAVQAVRRGAQDYLVKRQVNQDLLVRSLRYAIERKQAAEALREANEILELRVQERTAELQQANEHLRREIIRRQRIQERLEMAQQAGKIGSFEWNIRDNAMTWTAELEALYGLPPGAFNGHCRKWLQTIHPDDREATERKLWQAVEQSREFDAEFRIVCPNNEIRWIAAKSSILHDVSGQPLRMIGVHIDITDKKQLEAQFLRAQRLESLGTLASGIAHDLNNILTPILAVAQVLPLRLPDLEEQPRHLLQVLEASARRGGEMVKQILSFARGVEGKRTELRVDHLLQEIEKIIQQTFPKSIEIYTQLAADLWPLFGDETQLHQVLMNLCVNARDAMPEGGQLVITAENLWLDEPQSQLYLDAHVGAYVVITISDTGVGIPETILHRIFDPFFTTKEIGKGTGLGLSAALGIIKSHGGFVDVQSKVNCGSRFTLYFPAHQANDPQPTSDCDLLIGHQELIVIVDDEPSICEAIKAMLETYHYRVLIADNAIEALALFAEYNDQIYGVLVDIMMPDMDGLTAISLLKQLSPQVHPIAMSGLHSTDLAAQAEKLGFQGFLAKPFLMRDLLQLLRHS